jgi:hypothetical protein
MTSQLALYNEALRLIGERKLASLSENREPRRLLDAVWDGSGANSGAIDYCLEQGLWNFAMRTAQINFTPSIEPDFGYQRAFPKPEDFIRTAGVAIDPYFRLPLNNYTDEAGFWFADQDVLYVRYVSRDDQYGYDLSLWPGTFAKWVAAYLASEIVDRLTDNDAKRQLIAEAARRRLIDARSKDAMNEPTAFPPEGRWSSSRGGTWGRRNRDGGSRSSL